MDLATDVGAPDELDWVKSRKSTGVGMCVEVAQEGLEVLIRDSKDPYGRVLHFSRAEFDAFLDGCRHGDFDRFGGAD